MGSRVNRLARVAARIGRSRRTAGRGPRSGLTGLLVGLVALAQAGCLPAPPASAPLAGGWSAAPARPAGAFGPFPLLFIANQGQLDGRVAYYLSGRDSEVFFTAQGLTFALSGPLEGPASATQPTPPREGWVVKLDFVEARAGARAVGQDQAETIVSYFKGQPDQWQVGLPTYGQVAYEDLWPGVDLVYRGAVNQLKYDFIVKPGADPSLIRLAYRGATEVRLGQAGQLEVSTPVGGFSDAAPYAYQELDGRRVEVASGYELGAEADGAYGYGFRVGAYDPSRPLVLDPAVLVYAGYIGGIGIELGGGIAVDAAGNAYVTGATSSTPGSFPEKVGPSLTFSGNTDAFVAKVKADGTGLVYAGYIGGFDGDTGYSIAVDSAGNAYVTGATTSDETTFPVLVGPDLTFNDVDFDREGDAFVAKVNAAGNGLVYAGYIGGNGFAVLSERGLGIAVDGSNSAYVVGETTATEATFPVLGGPDLTHNGFSDAFVAKVKADGTGLVYAGYIGGSDFDIALGVAVDGSGNAYVVGQTSSTQATFPETVGPDLTHNGGSVPSENDAFVAKVNAAGSGLVYAGYIGGSGDDSAGGIAVDGSGNAYVAGTTESTQATFPDAVGPDLTHNGNTDAFVAKVKADGTGLVYAGFIGGSDSDRAAGIAVDGSGNAYLSGETSSTEATFPVTNGPDATYNGGQNDAFVAKVNAAGSALVYAGYIGGNGQDRSDGIAVDGSGNAYVIGRTFSKQDTFPVTVGPDLTYNKKRFSRRTASDAFIAKIALSP